MADVTSKPRNWPLSSLTIAKPILSEIFPALCDWILEYPVFERWSKESVNWHLYCVGEAGAGKTTLAAVIARHLRQQHLSAGYPVVTVFAEDDVKLDDAHFFEDFLHALYLGFEKWPIFSDDHSTKDYQKYTRERYSQDEGLRINRRLSLIRTALYKLLESCKEHFRAFLILDGFDLISDALRLLVETELARVQAIGVNVLRTSRIAPFEKDATWCDHAKHGDPDDEDEPIAEFDRERLDMFYNCEYCLSVLCLPCKAAGRTCDRDDCESKGPMRELYDHVIIPISMPSQDLKNYICWNLEREHGDIGLKSSARKPPLSALGLSIRNHKKPGVAQQIVSEIQRLSDGHIGFCKARLDVVNNLRSVEEWQQRSYQLPSNIVSMLDAVICAIEERNPLQVQHLALQSIAVASRYDWPGGVEIPLLRKLLKDCSGLEVRSGEDILRAARGVLHAPIGDKIQSAVIFSETIYEYVLNDYNQSVFEAAQELPHDAEGTEGEALSVLHPKEERVRFEPQTIIEEPAEITPSKLRRSVTTMEPSHELVFPRYVRRQGTRAWK